ncbi:MAG: glycosyltransferase family 4 protein [Desulfobulbaceae bacterium]|nr:glycosyltransferase family 4 protein [Desulfobulbaceae bacterium]
MSAKNVKAEILRKTGILVLAPRFPSINQPWMDTYLEQLQIHGIKFHVVTESNVKRKYHEKVDRLGLRQYVIPVVMERAQILRSSLCSAVFRPLVTRVFTQTAWKNFIFDLKAADGLKTILRILHCFYCAANLGNLGLIHAHSELFGYYFLPFAVQRQVPLIVTFHGLLPEGLLQLAPVRRKLLGSYAVCVIVNTNAAKQQAVTLGYPEEKIVVLPQGLPLDDYTSVARPAPTGDEPLHLLTVGRFHRDKGHAYALLALRKLVERGVDAHWHFVGAGSEKEKLAIMAQRLGVAERVTFYVDLDLFEIQTLYRKVHLFVLPSINNRTPNEHVETQGVVLQEAQASGCIPIATRVGGIPECIHDKEDGLLIPDRSHRAITDAICYLLERPEQWPMYQTKGRQNVEERFAADVIGMRMAGLLTEIMEKGNHA